MWAILCCHVTNPPNRCINSARLEKHEDDDFYSVAAISQFPGWAHHLHRIIVVNISLLHLFAHARHYQFPRLLKFSVSWSGHHQIINTLSLPKFHGRFAICDVSKSTSMKRVYHIWHSRTWQAVSHKCGFYVTPAVTAEALNNFSKASTNCVYYLRQWLRLKATKSDNVEITLRARPAADKAVIANRSEARWFASAIYKHQHLRESEDSAE